MDNTLSPITAQHLRETARAICKNLPVDELHSHPAWRAADRIDQLEQECDVLAVHLERIKEARSRDRVGPGFSVFGYINELQSAIDSSPRISLALRDLLKQVEAMDDLVDRKSKEAESGDDTVLRSKQMYAATCAANESNRLRRKAEGLQT